MIVDGYCPFLTCLETGPHEHAVCVDCGAVNHGNIDCRTCVLTWDISEESRTALLAGIDARDGAA